MGFFQELMGESSERRLFRQSGTIIKHGLIANRYLVEVSKGSNSWQKIKVVEEEADKEVFKLVTEITSGGIAPNLIDDMMRFVSMEDDIVDNIFILSRAACRYRIKDNKAREYVKKKLIDTCTLIEKSLNLLLKMQNAETISEMSRIRAQIEKYEQEDDELKEALLDFAYKVNLDYKDFYQVTEIAYLSDDVMDKCEDSADMLLTIMQSILT